MAGTADAVRERLGRPLRVLDQPIACPAGTRADQAGVPGCVCRLTDSHILATDDPSTLAAYCMNGDAGIGSEVGYTACPVWRDDKDRRREGTKPLLEEPEGGAARARAILERNQAIVERTLERREFWADEA